jgi:hypothetical protein
MLTQIIKRLMSSVKRKTGLSEDVWSKFGHGEEIAFD